MFIPACGPGEIRIGLTIDVPDPWASQIQEVRRRVGDPWADEIPPHITIIGPTVVRQRAVGEIVEHVNAVASQTGAFGISLKGTDTFRPTSPVVFLVIDDGASNCRVLASRMRRGPLDLPQRFAYHPHITVAQGVDDDALDKAAHLLRHFEVRFRVSALWLHEMCDDGVWRRRNRFELKWA